MGFIQKALQNKEYETGANYGLGQSLNLGTLTSKNDDTSASTVLRKYYTGVVYTCVGIIAREVAKHELKVYKRMANGDLRPVDKHDFVTLIKMPNKEQSEYDMAEATESFREMVGEYFIAFNMTKSSNKPAEAYALRPDMFTLVTDTKGEVIAYEYRRPDNKVIKFTPEEIVHDHTFNPNNSYRGVGTIQASIRNIAIEDSASQYTKSFFENNATPAGIVAVKGSQEGYTFGDSAHKKLKAKWLDEFKGSSNAGKLAFLREADVSYQQIGIGLDKVDMRTLREMTEDSIYKAFGIPTIYAGDFKNMNYASAEVAERVFTKNSIAPRLRKRQQVWQRVADQFWPGENFIVRYEDVVPEDKDRKLEVAKNSSVVGLTTDEARQLVGFDPLENKQGETIWRPMNLVEYGAQGKSVVRLKKKDVVDEDAIVKNHIENDAVRKESYRSQHEELQTKYEQTVEQEMLKYFEEQNKLVKENLAPKKGLKDLLFNKKDQDTKLKNALKPIITQLYVESGKLVVNFLGGEDDFTPVNNDVDEYISNQLSRMAEDFNENTMSILVETLTEGYAEGESIANIAKRIDKVYSEKYRAERVARTEVIRADNHAAQESYKQLGVTKKSWFANPGACPQCVAMDGRTVGITQNFLQKGEDYVDADGNERSNTYEDVAHPSLHPSCRCTILPVRS